LSFAHNSKSCVAYQNEPRLINKIRKGEGKNKYKRRNDKYKKEREESKILNGCEGRMGSNKERTNEKSARRNLVGKHNNRKQHKKFNGYRGRKKSNEKGIMF
jgi:hypothetical protein